MSAFCQKPEDVLITKRQSFEIKIYNFGSKGQRCESMTLRTTQCMLILSIREFLRKNLEIFANILQLVSFGYPNKLISFKKPF
jgi:hypothetical protein